MRCFISFDVSDEVKDFIYELQRKFNIGRFAKVNWVHKKNLHITLKFIGDIDENKMDEIKKVLSEVKFEKLKLRLNRLGFFPDDKKPKVVWIGLDPADIVIELQKRIDESLLGIFGSDQQFQAHLTIGRIKFVKKRKQLLDLLKEIKIERIAFEVDNFKLMKSELRREGPVYSVIEEYKLK